MSEETTLGRSIFTDGIFGSRTIPDIRNQIEIKLVACLAMGGTNGFPVSPDRIQNPIYKQIAAAAMSSKGWNIKDLTECVGRLCIPASGILIATLEEPIWGEDDSILMDMIESLESMEIASRKGGRTL